MKHVNTLLAIAVILILSAASSTCADLERLSESDSYRLPDTFVPTFYTVVFFFWDLEDDDYEGAVYITFHLSNTSSPTNDIYLHLDPDYIDISSIVLNDNISCYVQPPNETQIATVSCSENVLMGDNILYIEYTGRFSDDGYGVVKSRFKDQDEEEFLVESHFKPTYARRAFPCMDEPDLQASFCLYLWYPFEYTATSNTPNSGHFLETRGLVTGTRFEDTPPMSTYSLSILISKFNSETITSEEDIQVQILTRAEVANFTSAIVATYFDEILDQLNNYTGMPYKTVNDTGSYQVAVPDYSDATGDFGLFIYRETDFLDEGNKTTEWAKQNIITTMAYKMSHEWYGGDISTKWWSDVWANEAVATYLKYIIPSKIVDDYELEMQFVVEVVQKALQYDAMPFAQALSSSEDEVNRNWDIENKLDTISYQKGASILHMINYMIDGEENFQSSLQYHLNQRNNSDTDGSDIIRDLFEAQGDDYNDYYSYLETWVFSPGFPLLTVKLTNETDEVAEATLYQKSFVYSTDSLTNNTEGWYRSMKSNLEKPQGISILIKYQWLIHSLQGKCVYLYRVNYNKFVWKITNSVNQPKSLDVLNGAQLVDDVFNANRFVYPLDTMAKYASDRWYIPLSSATSYEQSFTVSIEGVYDPDDETMYFFGSNWWIMFNVQEGCYYRVNYDQRLWRRIIRSLKRDRTGIHVLNRAQLVDDIFNIARIGNVTYRMAFELSEFLANETEYYPWYSAFNAFGYLLGKMEDDGVEYNLKKRFIYPIENSTDDDTKWCIPLSSATEGTQQFNGFIEVIDTPDDEMIFFYGAEQWIILNTLQTGFYRVNYDDTLWGRIIDTLTHDRSEIHVLNRAQLVDDAFNVARIGEASYALAFRLSEFLANETEYYPWYAAFNAFEYFFGKLEDDEVEWNIKNYLLSLMDNVVEMPNADFSNDTHIDILKRAMVLEWACYLGHTGCISYATEAFKDFKDTQNDLEDYNYRGVIFCNGIRYSENVTEDWQFLWDTYETSISVHEQDDVLKALGCAEDEDLLQTYLLKIITTDSGIKKQDSLVVFNSVFSSSKGLKAAMDFLENNLTNIQAFYKDMTILSKMIYALAEKLLTDKQIDWLTTVIINDILDDYEDVRSKAIIIASVNNYWEKHYQKDVIRLFPSTSSVSITTPTSEYSPSSSGTTPTAYPSSTTTESKGQRTVSKNTFVLVILIFMCQLITM